MADIKKLKTQDSSPRNRVRGKRKIYAVPTDFLPFCPGASHGIRKLKNLARWIPPGLKSSPHYSLRFLLYENLPPQRKFWTEAVNSYNVRNLDFPVEIVWMTSSSDAAKIEKIIDDRNALPAKIPKEPFLNSNKRNFCRKGIDRGSLY